MVHKNLFLRFNSILAFRTQSLLSPFRKRHYQTIPPASLNEYLQTSLGFSPERALTLSQQLKGRNPKNRDVVVTFFKSHGLSKTQIKSIINRAPLLLTYASPESRLMPKIEFFKGKGISESDLVDLMVSNPRLFTHSLEQHIKPLFDVLCSIIGTEFAFHFLIQSKSTLNPYVLSANLTALTNCGVQNHHISKIFLKYPRVLQAKSDQFNKTLEMVKGMGFKLQSSLFSHAVITIVGLSRRTWDAKFKVYASLGWSAEEILLLFRKQPVCMRVSKEKIRMGFNYLTKEFGWGPSYFLIYPTLLFHSLEKRIIPRHQFLQFLASNGFIKEDKNFAKFFMMSEKKFLKNFVMRYESEVPGTLKISEGLIKSELLNLSNGKEGNVH